MLTINILTQNNETTLVRCLESLKTLDVDILIGDLSSTDNTREIAMKYGKVISLPVLFDRAKTRNDLIVYSKTDWQFYLEPWEWFSGGEEELLWAIEQNEPCYNTYNFQPPILNKETRLWNKKLCKFVRPVYESIEPEASQLLNVFIKGESPDRIKSIFRSLQEWNNSAIAPPDINYYYAFTYLGERKYNEFLSYANKYLFAINDSSTSSILTKYYIAKVQMSIKKDYGEAVKQILNCIAQVPTMAEFWCLLGDIFIRLRQYNRAYAFYENGMILGERRLRDDPFPVEIEKYKSYPEKMMNACREMFANSEIRL